MSAALIAEALRLNDRYLMEVVTAFGLCPWAERALREGRVHRRVVVDPDPAPQSVLPLIDELEDAAASALVDIGLFIFPRFAVTAAGFDRYTERLRQADRARRPADVLPAFVLAAFHPQPPIRTPTTPHQLVPFIRRTPDPTIQLVRESTLRELRRTAHALYEGIAERNHAAVTAAAGAGLARLDAVADDILRDRDRAYAQIAFACP